MSSTLAVSGIVVEWATWVLAFPFIVLRLYVRGRLQGQLSWADGFLVASWLIVATGYVADLYIWRWGAWDVDIKFNTEFGGDLTFPNFAAIFPNKLQREKVLKGLFLTGLPYYASLYLVKFSFLLFYYQLFPPHLKGLRRALWGTTFASVLGLIIAMCMNLFWCLPIKRNWSTNQSELCLSAAVPLVYFFTTGFHLITDILVFILPFLLFRHLGPQISKEKVLGLVVVFSLGALCIISTIGRTVCVILNTRLPVIALWSGIETTTAIIVACCPPLKWLWQAKTKDKHSIKNWTKSSSRSTGNSSGKKGGQNDTTLLQTLREDIELENIITHQPSLSQLQTLPRTPPGCVLHTSNP